MDANEVLIAVPSAKSEQMRAIVEQCKESGLVFKTLPGMGELIDGKVSVSAIRWCHCSSGRLNRAGPLPLPILR
ncbi:MAG: hypothetical protein PF503_08625 [Desulfobacula sp.]|nr:hypothetical protein [Desulfobacula sp.]